MYINHLIPREGMVKSYERKGLYTIEDVLSKIGPKPVMFDADLIQMDSPRYRVFKKSLQCVNCDVKGEFFAKERNARKLKGRGDEVWVSDPSQCWHFNLYGLRKDNTVVLMTKDHIIPRSRGGSDDLDNLQTMCTTCNGRKGNRLPGQKFKAEPYRRNQEPKGPKTVSKYIRYEIYSGEELVGSYVELEEAIVRRTNMLENGKRNNLELVKMEMIPTRTKMEWPE